MKSQTKPVSPWPASFDATDGRRSGLTLLEIVLSLAIFVGAIAALSQLATNGTRATVTARLKTQATIRCETKLNEVLAGIEQMASRSGTPFPDDSHWTWSQIVTPSSHKELVQIDLTVSHRGNSKLANVDVTLRRWAREQVIFVQGATQERQEAEKAEARKQQ
jgi:general secretion pathway protein I